MLNKINLPRLIGVVVIIIIISFVFLIIKLLFLNNIDTTNYLTKTNHKIDLKLNGDNVIYLNIGSKYKEQGANTNTNKKININYYKNNRKVINIDTSSKSAYTVKYSINDNNKKRTITRIVIVRDNKKPYISFPETTSILTNEIDTYKYTADVLVTDNSNDVTLKYSGRLKKKAGNYIIKYIATDNSGNKTTRKRLIKVIQGITFKTKDNKIKLIYLKNDGFKYYYSTDNGQTFNLLENDITLNQSNDTVIVSIYKNDTYTASITYTKRKE